MEEEEDLKAESWDSSRIQVTGGRTLHSEEDLDGGLSICSPNLADSRGCHLLEEGTGRGLNSIVQNK